MSDDMTGTTGKVRELAFHELVSSVEPDGAPADADVRETEALARQGSRAAIEDAPEETRAEHAALKSELGRTNARVDALEGEVAGLKVAVAAHEKAAVLEALIAKAGLALLVMAGVTVAGSFGVLIAKIMEGLR